MNRSAVCQRPSQINNVRGTHSCCSMDQTSDQALKSHRCQLLDLPWEDVLVTQVLCFLPLRELLILQRVCKSFQSLIQVYLTNLRTFDLEQTGPGLPKAAFSSLLHHSQVIHHLSVAHCSDWLNDSDLLPVIGQNQHILSVNLRSCAHLSRQTLVCISLSCPRLRKLYLAHCEWVDGLALRSLADHCPDLRVLDLTACRQLRDQAIGYLAGKCQNLQEISVAVNANITDAAVEEVAKKCPQLENMDLTGCLRVRNDSIRTLAEYCPKLKSLKVNHCHNVNESSLGILRRRNVQIDVEPPLQRALVLLQDIVGFAPFINLQI